jgi:1,4-dihydroxy-2-naphthoate octaprenyltransferase
MKESGFKFIVRITNPYFLLAGVLTYALGAGIARYFGDLPDWGIYFLGQAWITSVQLGTIYLKEYFNPAYNPAINERKSKNGDPLPETIRQMRAALLFAAATMLTIVAILTFLLYKDHLLNPVLMMILLFSFLGAFFYATPPVRLADNGYGELVISIFIANLTPMLACLLQSADLHPLLAMSTFPLTLFYLAMLLAVEFRDYAEDMKNGKSNLLIRMGWQRSMRLHNFLILGAFLLLAAGASAGLPWRIAWPVFLTLPLGVFQIWQMGQIAGGEKPRWKLLVFIAAVLFGLPAYLLAFSYWIV